MQDRPTGRQKIAFRILLLLASFAIGAMGWFLLGESESVIAAESPSEKALARIGDRVITEAEINELLAPTLLKIERERHELITNAVKGQIRSKLIDLEAAKRGITRDELIEQEINAKLGQVPDQQVQEFYDARKNRIRKPLADVEVQIRQLLASEALYSRLEKNYDIQMLIEPFRISVDPGDGPAKGPADAPVTVVEFSDFQCPYCNRVAPALEQVHESYGDKVRIVFRHFPLDQIHPNARKAGEAAVCAQDQGQFWALHDKMFADQQNLGVEGLEQMAAAIEGLDTERFDRCLESGETAERVQEDVDAGKQLGVSGTPSVFVNGRYLSGTPSYEAIVEVIDDELSRLQGKG